MQIDCSDEHPASADPRNCEIVQNGSNVKSQSAAQPSKQHLEIA
jgi:hypothetical protein